MKVKPTYQELENRIKELESNHYKSDIIDFESLSDFEKKIVISKAKIEESEAKYKALYENAPLSYQSLDVDGNFLDINPTWLTTLGYPRDEVIGKWFGDFLHPDDVEHFRTNFPKFKKKGSVSNVNFRIQHKKGHHLDILFEGCIGYNPNGSFKQTYCTFKDITLQRNIEEKLKKSEERLSQVMDNSGDWVWEVDTNGLYTYVSDTIEDVLGYKTFEIINKKHFYDFFNESKHEDLKKHNFERMKQKKSFRDAENLNVAKNGGLVWVSTSGTPVLDENGDLIGYRGTDTNITEKKKAEQLLKDSNERWKSLFHDIPNVAVQGYDKNGKTIYWNKASEAFYGYASEEAIGSKLTDLIIPEEAKSYVSDAIKEMITTKIPIPSSELKLKRKDGSSIFVFSSHSYVEVPGREPEMYCVDIDITERKQAKEALEKSEEEYRLLAENAVDFVWAIDLELNTKYVSPGGYKITGYTEDEMLRKNVKEIFSEDRFVELKNIIKKEISLDKLHVGKTFESEYISKNGKRIPVEISAKIIRDKDFNPIGINGRTSDISKRKEEELELLKAKEKAEESKVKFEILSNVTFEGILIHDKGVPVDMNNSLVKMFGYNNGELENINLAELLIKEEFHTIIYQNIANQYTLPYEVIGIKKDGTEFPVEIEGKTFLSDDNKQLRLTALRDISKRKKDEKALLKAKEKAEEIEENYRKLVEKMPDGVYKSTHEGKFVAVNPAMVKMLGYNSKEELFALDIKNDLYIEATDRNSVILNELSQELGVFQMRKKDGAIIWVEDHGWYSFDELGEIKYHEGVMRDVTERIGEKQELIKAKEHAEEGEESYKALFESIGDAIYIQDYDAKFINVNSGVLNMYGYSKEEFIGNTPLFLSAPDMNDMPAIFEIFDKVKKGTSQVFEFWGKRKNGEIFPKTVGQYKGTYFGQDVVITLARDISNQVKTQQELLKAKEKAEESDKLKTEFINNMSHEIRTPMNGIMGFSEMLSDTNISDKKRANFVKVIKNSSRQLLTVIDAILEISKLGTKQVKVIETDVCLNDVLLNSFSTFDIKAKEQKIPLYLKKGLSDTLSTIRTDRTKINKVISNLLENALKFTNEGFIEFGYQLKNDNIELYVKDTGIGIEKSKHELIFDRFSQAEKELSKNVGGLGLGLSIAKENAELLGGSIQLESKKEKGSTFFVTIPYKPVYKDNAIEKTKTGVKYTILIAEDEEINYLYIETLLNDVLSLDCKIIHVINGEEAIEACKDNKTIDLVLMDLKMPILNGFEATKLIKKLRPNLPIIAQTAYSSAQDKEKAILVGCDDFISKPIHQESFKNILDKYFIK